MYCIARTRIGSYSECYFPVRAKNALVLVSISFFARGSFTVTNSEPNEASLWKITLQKRENYHVDAGTFIPPLTQYLYIILFGKSVPVYVRGHFTPGIVFNTDFSGNFLHSVFLKDIFGKFPHSRGKNLLPGSFRKSLPYKTKDLAINEERKIERKKERKKGRKKERKKKGKEERKKERRKERKKN